MFQKLLEYQLCKVWLRKIRKGEDIVSGYWEKTPRIGRKVVNAFEQSGCEIFVGLFCGNIAIYHGM